LTGGAGNDAFIFKAGEANGDSIMDFAGNDAAAGGLTVLNPIPAEFGDEAVEQFRIVTQEFGRFPSLRDKVLPEPDRQAKYGDNVPSLCSGRDVLGMIDEVAGQQEQFLDALLRGRLTPFPFRSLCFCRRPWAEVSTALARVRPGRPKHLGTLSKSALTFFAQRNPGAAHPRVSAPDFASAQSGLRLLPAHPPSAGCPSLTRTQSR
jgi:hypothetical protein